jgi:hypothetical protein
MLALGLGHFQSNFSKPNRSVSSERVNLCQPKSFLILLISRVNYNQALQISTQLLGQEGNNAFFWPGDWGASTSPHMECKDNLTYFLHLCPILIQPGIPIEKLICCVIEGWSIKETSQAINAHSFSYSAIFHTSKVLANSPSILLISKVQVYLSPCCI